MTEDEAKEIYWKFLQAVTEQGADIIILLPIEVIQKVDQARDVLKYHGLKQLTNKFKTQRS